MTVLIVSAKAETDTFDILNELEAKAGTAVSVRYATRFRDSVARLLEMPEIGSLRPALGAETRGVVIAPYVMIYDYIEKDELIVLLRILHGRRNISKETIQK